MDSRDGIRADGKMVSEMVKAELAKGKSAGKLGYFTQAGCGERQGTNLLPSLWLPYP
jgi:hypothetical protein